MFDLARVAQKISRKRIVGDSLCATHSRTVGRCHLKTEAILWPSLPYYTRNNSSTTICSDKLLRIFSNTSRLCMNHFITRSHSHGCDKEVARWEEYVFSVFTFKILSYPDLHSFIAAWFGSFVFSYFCLIHHYVFCQVASCDYRSYAQSCTIRTRNFHFRYHAAVAKRRLPCATDRSD